MNQGILAFPPLFQVSREEIAKAALLQQQQQLAAQQALEVEEEQPYFEPEPVQFILNEPNRTLYVNRLNEKISIEEMRQTLFALFSQCGKVLDVSTKRNIKMRGQAFIIMESIQVAIQAQSTFDNYVLFDKTMTVNFAKEKTDFIAKEDGTFVEKEKLPMSDRIKEHKKLILEKRQREMVQRKSTKEAPTISMPLGSLAYTKDTKPKYGNQPNKVLFIEGLQLVDFGNLDQHFRNFYGFKEFRGIRQRNVAFVEFEDELKATHCLNELNGTQFEGVPLQISYQKK